MRNNHLWGSYKFPLPYDVVWCIAEASSVNERGRGEVRLLTMAKKQLSNLCYKKEELYEHRCNGKVLSQW